MREIREKLKKLVKNTCKNKSMNNEESSAASFLRNI